MTFFLSTLEKHKKDTYNTLIILNDSSCLGLDLGYVFYVIPDVCCFWGVGGILVTQRNREEHFCLGISFLENSMKI